MADHACPECGAVHREKPVSLKQRVEMLEEKVRQLEARQGPQWTYTPAYYPMTVGDSIWPSGNIPDTTITYEAES